MENQEKIHESDLNSFAKNLENNFENFTEIPEKNGKINENSGNSQNNDGWTLRSILDCFGVNEWQSLLSVADKKTFEFAIKNYPKEVQKACGTITSINGAMANFRARTIEKLMKKYSYNIDLVISDEVACAIACTFNFASVYMQARFTAEAISKDLEILEKKEEK